MTNGTAFPQHGSPLVMCPQYREEQRMCPIRTFVKSEKNKEFSVGGLSEDNLLVIDLSKSLVS